MTTAEVRTWFSRGRRLDEHINSLLETQFRIRNNATSTTARYSGDVVDGSRDPHRKHDAVAEIDDMINREIDRLDAIKKEILDVVLHVDSKLYQDLLMKRYVDCKRWENVAVELGYDYYYVKGALHKKALNAARSYMRKSGY